MVLTWHFLGGFYWGISIEYGFGHGGWTPPVAHLEKHPVEQYCLMLLWAVSTTMGEVSRDAGNY
jgi:hypothetical protein